MGMIGIVSVSQGEELEKMAPEMSQLYAMHLTDVFKKEHKDLQTKFEVDPSQASGLRAGNDGIVAVPIKGLKEGEIDPAVESETGAGLCYLFLSPCFTPTIGGKPVDTEKLRRIKIDNGQGSGIEAICMIVTVKHIDGDDWRLFGFGNEKKPILSAQFDESAQGADKSLAIAVKERSKKELALEFTLHKKYAASFSIAAK